MDFCKSWPAALDGPRIIYPRPHYYLVLKGLAARMAMVFDRHGLRNWN